MFRPLLFLIFLLLFGPPSLAQNSSAEPPSPQPTPAIQKLLAEVDVAAKVNQFPAMLAAAEKALNAARSEKDLPGEATALETKAEALVLEAKGNSYGEGGFLSPEKHQSLMLSYSSRWLKPTNVYRESANIWHKLGDGPSEARVMSKALALLIRIIENNLYHSNQMRMASNGIGSDQSEAIRKVKEIEVEICSLAKAEKLRPHEMVTVLNEANTYFTSIGQDYYYPHLGKEALDIFYRVSVEICEIRFPDTREMAFALSRLGKISTTSSEREAYTLKALDIYEKKNFLSRSR